MYDNTCKYLAEKSPASFVRWLLNTEPENITVLKTEILPEPIEADALVLLQTANQILHLEFQTVPYSNPPIPLRMLEYKALLTRKYRLPIEQVVIFLKHTNSELVFQNQYHDDYTTHRYRIMRIWEENPAPLLVTPELLPLATLAKSDNPNTLLEQVAHQVAIIEETEQRQNISACVFVLAGLRFEKNLIRQLFREDVMRESVTYQDILEQGVQQGMQRGMQRGEVAILQRQISRRFGELEPQLKERIQRLAIPQLEELGEALFDFSNAADLAAWLQVHHTDEPSNN
ncbi:MAG TPA: Rpn family recombination-promoting nuclease/putative transposase [Kamptonema sp.]|nr:Rpn family recombination-promoting nuclease/putative transposase [Kamptonema sp.]